jgi:hypothetical protein
MPDHLGGCTMQTENINFRGKVDNLYDRLVKFNSENKGKFIPPLQEVEVIETKRYPQYALCGNLGPQKDGPIIQGDYFGSILLEDDDIVFGECFEHSSWAVDYFKRLCDYLGIKKPKGRYRLTEDEIKYRKRIVKIFDKKKKECPLKYQAEICKEIEAEEGIYLPVRTLRLWRHESNI